MPSIENQSSIMNTTHVLALISGFKLFYGVWRGRFFLCMFESGVETALITSNPRSYLSMASKLFLHECVYTANSARPGSST